MADSGTDFTKMKVVELRKELKSRGLPCSGDKSELVARLQSAVRDEVTTGIALDSDEIDSDAVLDDEDDKSHSEIFGESINESINEDLVLADPPPAPKTQRTLKRKISNTVTPSASTETSSSDNKEPKKITLKRTISVTATDSNSTPAENETKEDKSNKIKAAESVDTKSKLEMRAKRFGLPVNMSENERKEARRIRFGQNTNVSNNTVTPVATNLDKLKKRAERFGQSVSNIMTDLENREKLEKRKQKFSSEK